MLSIKNVYLLTKKDLKGYFSSPIAWIFMAVFSLVMGFMFIAILNFYMKMNLQFDAQRMGKGPSLSDNLIRPIYGNMNVVLMIIIPFVTMRLFAEEKKNNTFEFLITSPLRLSEIVLGKYFSALSFTAILLALTVPYPLAMYLGASPDWAVIGLNYLGTFLMVAVYVAVGTMCSSFTENQIVAGATTFGFIIFFWIIKWPAYNAGQTIADILGYLSVLDHFEEFSKGVFNTKDIVFYISSIFTWLFITHKSLESYTWRA